MVNKIPQLPELMPWPHSKLETGMAVTKLFNNKLLENKTDYNEKNELTVNGIRKISDLFT